MKILMVSHYFLPYKGGLPYVVFNQAKELVKRGHEVTIVSSKLGNEPKKEIIDGIKVIRLKNWNIFEDKIGIPFPIPSIRIFKVLNKEAKKVDLIYVHDFFYLSIFVGALVSKIHKKPLILMQHIKVVNTSKKIVNFAQWLVYKTYGKFIINRSKKIIVCNKTVDKWIKSNNKTVFLPNCVDKMRFAPIKLELKQKLREKYNIPIDKKIVLFVGRLVECKNFDKLFDAKDEDYLILFVGNGNIPSHMKNNKQVRFIGTFNQHELKEIYQLSDIFVLPSKNEGFPLTILEAMACGLPIIASDLQGYGEYLDREKVILLKPTPQNIKNGIKRVLKNPNLAKKMSDYSRKTIEENFNWENNVNKLLKIFNEVLENETQKAKKSK